MPAVPASPFLPAVAGFDDFALTLLEVALTGFILFRPVYDAASETIIDLAYEYLNPAAQQMLRLPQHPAESFLTLFPTAGPAGIFAFYHDAFLSGQTCRQAFNFQHDGLDGYFQLMARRQGALLVVSFTDTNDQPRTVVEEALRQSQARELAAHAEAEKRRQIHQALMQLPANVVLLQGPSHVFTLVNPSYQQLFAGRSLLGKSVHEALPELAGQGFFDVLDRVYQTGEPFSLPEAETWADFAGTGQPQLRYYNASFLPLVEQGQVTGILNVAFDVTPQVVARQQADRFNEELELRVTARSAETRAALFKVEQQREQLRGQQRILSQILGQVPAAIATLNGPEHRYSFFNEPYQALSAGRSVLGHTVGEVFPELVEQGIISLLDQVYATGQPFIGTEILLMMRDAAMGQVLPHYVDFTYQPLLDGQQQTSGILIFALDVTEKVRARKQAETLQAAMLAVVQRQAQQRQDLFSDF
jgi:PAS domain-containing protein